MEFTFNLNKTNMENNTKLSEDVQNELLIVYESATSKLFEIWKTEFLSAYEANIEKDEYADEILTWVKNTIFNRVNTSLKDFVRFDFEPDKKQQFYVHLFCLKASKKINYSFLNREIDGKKIDPFEGEDIPEIYAGAFWKYYQYLVKGDFRNTKEVNIIKLTIEEAAYLCYFNKTEVTEQNSNEIIKLFGNKSGRSLINSISDFKNKNIDSGTSTLKKDQNKIQRYKKIIPYISNEIGKQQAIQILNELTFNHQKAINDGAYND